MAYWLILVLFNNDVSTAEIIRESDHEREVRKYLGIGHFNLHDYIFPILFPGRTELKQK
jgi:hypothetical protein